MVNIFVKDIHYLLSHARKIFFFNKLFSKIDYTDLE